MKRRSIHRWLLPAALFALALMGASAAPASALTFGLNWDGNHTSTEELLNDTQASGATVWHQPLQYTGPGGDWTGNDELVEEAWARGITILPTLQTGELFLVPTDPEWEGWGTWVREAVERYGVNGTFWEGKVNPAPITAWEVWNEPNIVGDEPRPAEAENYGAFLNYSAEAIQAASLARSGAPTNVLFGSINTQVGEAFEAFLAGAATTGGLSPNVTGVAIHPYAFAAGAAGMAAEITSVREYLDALPEGVGKTLWITEVGWPTHGHVPAGETASEEGAATLLTESLEWVKANAEADRIENVDWYNLRDFGGPTWDGWSGLIDQDGDYQPAWYAFQEQTGAERSGDLWAAFQAETGTLWLYSTTGGYQDTGLPMMPGSSPTIAAQPGGGALVSFQNPDGTTATYSTRAGAIVAGLPAQTQPSNENPLATAFKAYISAIWPTSDAGGAFETTAHLAPGTVPSVDTVP
ncbi:MAG: hypothetical protein JST53_18220 [Actinobacteria bacterium]|nr:hypothetical protein [Actinomycetota bacterium]